jgi:chemotaxis protein MotB
MAENEEGSQSGNSERPIIIKKIKKGGHGHHGGAWKVAYADFVTALMAFFIVMWILASSAEVKESVAAYFNAPEDYNIFTGIKTAPVTLFDNPAPPSSGDGDGDGVTNIDVQFSFSESQTTDTAKISGIKLEALKDSINAAKEVSNTGNEIKNEIEEMAKNATDEMKTILSSIEIVITKDGMRIELIESHDNNFFEIGSARLKPEAISILKQLAKRIQTLPNYVEIEGHTDSRGYASNKGYTNWELSSDRANAARKVLEGNGLWDGQVTSVSGFADRKLRNPNNPFDYSNRRVSILVKNVTTSEFINSNYGEHSGR